MTNSTERVVVRRITVLLAYVLLHGGYSEYGLWLRHINLGLGKTNDDSDAVEGLSPLHLASLGKAVFRREPRLPGKSMQIAAKKKEDPRPPYPARPRDGWHFSGDGVRFLQAGERPRV
jgi:hypothetical protein